MSTELATSQPFEIRKNDPKVLHFIASRADELVALLPIQAKPRFLETLVHAIRVNPALHAVEPASVLTAAYNAARLGLAVSPGEGGGSEAYIVPYGKVATLIPGWKGLVKLMKLSGDAVDVGACAVHEGEHYRLSFGEVAEHDNDPACWKNPILFYYGWAKLRNEQRVTIIVDIDTMRARDTNRGPWQKHKKAMQYKTCIRELANRGKVQLNPDTANALSQLEAQYAQVHEVSPTKSIKQLLAEATVGPAMLDDGTPIIDTDIHDQEEAE